MRRTWFIASVLAFSFVGMLLGYTIWRDAKQNPFSVTVDGAQMEAANSHYERGDYALAAKTYEQMINQDIIQADLYYNLGNSYFKLGELGKAIAAYREAKSLKPRDADIQANLQLCRRLRAERIIDEGQNMGILGVISQPFTLDEHAFIALGLWFLFAILLMMFSGNRRLSVRRDVLLYTTLIILAMSIIALGERLYEANTNRQGVIVVDEVAVLSGPGQQYAIQFLLHDGAEIFIMEERANWARIELSGGKMQGWVENNRILSILSP